MSAPTLTDDGFGDALMTILKSAQPVSPVSFSFWTSLTGVGTPASDPLAWTAGVVSTVTDGGGSWDSNGGQPASGLWAIGNYQTAGGDSDWSNKLLIV